MNNIIAINNRHALIGTLDATLCPWLSGAFRIEGLGVKHRGEAAP